MTTKLDGSSGIIFPDNSIQSSAAYTAWRNRLLNGDFRINQYYGSTAVTPTVSALVADRWLAGLPAASKLTFQQVTDAPPGYSNAMKISVASTYAPAANEALSLQQRIEGVNIVDFAFGSTGACYVALSTQIKGTVPGNYAVSLVNSGGTRSIVGLMTVTTSWAPVTVVFPPCTDGAWLTDTNIGVSLRIDLGCGSNFENGSTGVWQAGNYTRTPSAVKLVSQSVGAALYLTGVQLEPVLSLSNPATPFERVEYDEMLRRCQRYYEVVTNRIVTVLDSTALNRFSIPAPFLVTKRADPVTTITSFTSYNGSALTVTASPSFKADGGFIAQGTTSTNLSQSLAYTASATHTSEL